MNKEEWNLNKYTNKYYWYSKVRKIQKSLEYNSDPKATLIHHLIDSEEQRKYNNEHYEFWGFEIDENGNEYFEYGKYVIFVTRSWHTAYHASLEGHKQLVGKKISESKKGYHHTEESKQKISKSHLGKPGMKGDKHSNFGKPAYNKGIPMSDEAKQKSREKHLGKSSEHLKACKILYKAYKQGNGILSWNEFQKYIGKGYISFEYFPITIYV